MNRKPETKERDLKILLLIETGLKYRDISKQIGCSESEVSRTARRFGIRKYNKLGECANVDYDPITVDWIEWFEQEWIKATQKVLRGLHVSKAYQHR